MKRQRRTAISKCVASEELARGAEGTAVVVPLKQNGGYVSRDYIIRNNIKLYQQ